MDSREDAEIAVSELEIDIIKSLVGSRKKKNIFFTVTKKKKKKEKLTV